VLPKARERENPREQSLGCFLFERKEKVERRESSPSGASSSNAKRKSRDVSASPMWDIIFSCRLPSCGERRFQDRSRLARPTLFATCLTSTNTCTCVVMRVYAARWSEGLSICSMLSNVVEICSRSDRVLASISVSGVQRRRSHFSPLWLLLRSTSSTRTSMMESAVVMHAQSAASRSAPAKAIARFISARCAAAASVRARMCCTRAFA
jgi:hypothetical protein